MPAGRPTAYKPELCEDITNLCLLGLTDSQIAEHYGIPMSTLSLWKNEHPELMEAIRLGRTTADAKVAASLRSRALGSITIETKTDAQGNVTTVRKQLPPDTAAASLWLRNRHPDRWRDQKDIGGKLTLEAILEDLDDE